MNVATLWSIPFEKPVLDCALSSDGSVSVLGCKDGLVYCAEASGQIGWSHDTGRPVNGVAITDNGERIFAASWDGKLYCFGRKGSLAWSFDAGGFLSKVSTTRRGDRTVFGSYKGYLTCVDRWGELAWKEALGSEVETAAISRSGDVVVGASDEGKLVCLSGKGETLWSREVGGRIWSTKALEDVILAAANDDYVHAFDLDGNSLWKLKVGSAVLSLDSAKGARNIIAGGYDSIARLYDSERELVWDFRAEGRINGVAIASCGNILLVGSDDGKLSCFEAIDEGTSILYEIMCRSEGRCGNFVSATHPSKCPRCGGKKISIRTVKEKL